MDASTSLPGTREAAKKPSPISIFVTLNFVKSLFDRNYKHSISLIRGFLRFLSQTRNDLVALLVWTAAIAGFFWDFVSLRRALFYFDITEINYPYRAFLAEEI